MWSLEWPETGSAAQHSMSSPSSTSGLFDVTGRKHEPPDDHMDLDPDLLRTLDLPHRTSTDSLNSEPDMSMMDNWQMNEVFQDISAILNESTDELPSEYDHATDVDQLVKTIFDDSIESADSLPSSEIAHTSVDLSWIIQETIGSDATPSDDCSPCNQYDTINLPSLSTQQDINIDYDLLNQLEAMEGNTSSISVASQMHSELTPAPATPQAATISSPRSSASDADDSASVVAIDHQYTQLSSVKVKPHETKKQAIRRVKNNAASRVCRKQRKNRLVTNMDRVAELAAKNSELLQKIRDVESVVALLKDHLVKSTRKQ